MANTEVVLKRIVTRASDPLVLDLYRRIRADRHRTSTVTVINGKLKSWQELLLQIRQEGLLNRSESAAILKWARRKQLSRRGRTGTSSWQSNVRL